MRDSARRWLGVLALAGALCLLQSGSALNASARSRTIKTEGEWVGFDPEINIVTVMVKKPGDRVPGMKILRKKRLATFRVKPGGFLLTRTTVAIRGQKGELGDIAKGRKVNVYWLPDDDEEGTRFAHKIDVILSDDEVDEMYGIEEVE